MDRGSIRAFVSNVVRVRMVGRVHSTFDGGHGWIARWRSYICNNKVSTGLPIIMVEAWY